MPPEKPPTAREATLWRLTASSISRTLARLRTPFKAAKYERNSKAVRLS
jgi:hypothetical protein